MYRKLYPAINRSVYEAGRKVPVFQVGELTRISGRSFRDDDVAGRPAVAIVNQDFVRRFSRGTELVGRQLMGGRPATIIAVVGNVRMSALKIAPEPQIYTS